MTNRMDYIHRKSRGRALNESMLNEAVYNMKDVREMWYKKIKLLSDPRKQINLHAKLSKIEPGLRDAELAKILLHNFPGTSPGFINSIISSTFGDPDWLEILNTRFGTNIDIDYLKSCFARMRGPELDQKTLQAIGKKEDAFIKQIESGRGNTKSEEVMKVAASTKRTYIAGSFEEVYELVTTRNDFEGRYEKNPDGTISINMADIPLTMVRAMYGLRAVDDSQPLVYIVFGPNGGNDKIIKDHAKQELDLFLRNSHEEKELQEMHIGYYDLRPCGLEYWWTNVSKRFVSKKDNEAVDKVRNSNATLVLSRDGECVLMTEGFESEPEIDPAVNPGNAPVTAPIEDEYGFDTVKESMNRHYSRTLNEAVVSFYKPVSEIAFKWLLWRTKKEGVNVKIKKVDENNESYIKFYINDKQCGYYELSTKKLVYDQDCKELVQFIKILHEMEEALAHGFIISDFNEPNYSKGQTSNEPDYSKFESMNISKNVNRKPLHEEQQQDHFIPAPKPNFKYVEEAKLYRWSQIYQAFNFYMRKIWDIIVPVKMNYDPDEDYTSVRKHIINVVNEATNVIKGFEVSFKEDWIVYESLKPLARISEFADYNSDRYEKTWYRFIYEECLSVTQNEKKKCEKWIDELYDIVERRRKEAMMQESKNNDIRMNRYNRNWAKPESARLRRFADMLESMDDTRYSRKLNETSVAAKHLVKISSHKFVNSILAVGDTDPCDKGYRRPYAICTLRPYFFVDETGEEGCCLADGRIRIATRDSYSDDVTLNYYTVPEFLREYGDYTANIIDLISPVEDDNKDTITLTYGEYENWDTNKKRRKEYKYTMINGFDRSSAMRDTANDDKWDRREEDMEPMYAESYRPIGRKRLYEAKALTPEEKMDRWRNGTRKENIKACNIDKLKEYRKICRAKGYTEQVKIINAELKRRKDEGINESQLPSRGINLQPGGEFYNMDKNTFMSIYDMLVKKYGEDRIIYNKLGYGIVTLWLDEIGPNGYEIIFWSELGTLIDVDLLRHLLPGSIFV